jgi:site-specific DNA-methyltransferase (adenine-specific)
MADDAYQALKADIAAHGLREPVWTWRGELIDGRHRLRACRELGVEPLFREWDGEGSLVTFVVSLNLHRRSLTPGQRALLSAEIEPALAREAKERQTSGLKKGKEKPVQEIVPEREKGQARDQAARQTGTNGRYVSDAKAVMEKAPDLVQKVKDGTLTLPQARQEVRRREKREELTAKAAAAPPPEDTAWRIVTGDVLEETGPDVGGPRLIFADPPYNVGVDYGEGKEADLLPEYDYYVWCSRWIAACHRVLADDGTLWLLIDHEHAAVIELILRGSFLLPTALRGPAFHVRSRVTWYETFGVNCPDKFNCCSRRLFYCVKDRNAFAFNADPVTRPSDRQAKYRDRRAAPGGKLWDDVWGVNPPIPRLTGTSAERLPDFPTQLPLALVTPIVLCASDPGDLVLDPFSGSGTTGVAAVRNGRRYLGVEKNPAFAALSRDRLRALRTGAP